MYNHKLISKKPILDNSQNKIKKRKNDENDEEDDSHELVTCEDNHIYFYDDVNTKTILLLLKHIKTLNTKLLLLKTDIDIKYNFSVNPVIYLHINSCGGYITDALAAINYIKNSRVPIISIIDGYAASAATFLSIVCHTRQITEYSCMLVHQSSGYAYGTFEQLKDEQENAIYLQNQLKKLYIEHSKGKLTNKKLETILKHDLMWNPTKCLENGLVDEII